MLRVAWWWLKGSRRIWETRVGAHGWRLTADANRAGDRGSVQVARGLIRCWRIAELDNEAQEECTLRRRILDGADVQKLDEIRLFAGSSLERDNIRIFDSGIRIFADDAVSTSLRKILE